MVARLLPPGELLQASAPQNFGHVQIADGVRPDAVRTPEFAGIVAPFAAEPTQHVALEVDDAHAIFQLGHVHDVVGADVQFGRALEAGPDVQEIAIARENLDSIVLAIRDINLAGVLPDGMDGVEEVRLVLRLLQVACMAGLSELP